MRNFRKNEFEKILRDWYTAKARSPLKRKKSKIGGTVFDLQPEISSQETTQIVVEVEPLMGFRVKTGMIIKQGGYRNIEEFVSYTMPRLEKLFNAKYNAPRKLVAHHAGGVANVR
jgi:hypothetical protein